VIVKFKDPREQPVFQPDQDAAWQESRRFRQRLQASVEMNTLACEIADCHMAYEGWPLIPGDPLPIYKAAAETAVRSCSIEVQACAASQLEQYAAATYDDLAARLRSCDATPEARVREIKRWARELVAVHTYHLRHEAGRHPLEVKQFEQEQGVLDGLD